MAHDLKAPVDIAEATQSINDHQIDRLEEIVKQHDCGMNVGILGLSYKPGTDVVEESSGVHLANRLKERGYNVTVYDPEAMDAAKSKLNDGIACASTMQECLESSDLSLIMTDWPEFKGIDPHNTGSCKRIIDCWRVLKKEDFTNGCLISYLGQGQEIETLVTA